MVRIYPREVLLLLIQRGKAARAGGGGAAGSRRTFSLAAEVLHARPPGAGKVLGTAVRVPQWPQRAMREAGRGAGDPMLLTFPSPA